MDDALAVHLLQDCKCGGEEVLVTCRPLNTFDALMALTYRKLPMGVPYTDSEFAHSSQCN